MAEMIKPKKEDIVVIHFSLQQYFQTGNQF